MKKDIFDLIAEQDRRDKIANFIGQFVGAVAITVALAYGLIYSSNLIFKTSYPYDFPHVFAFWIILTVFGRARK